MTTDISEMIALYDELTGFDQTVDIRQLIPNSKRRKGMTARSLDDGTLQSNKKIPVLHAYINLLRWFEEANYYFNARKITANGQIPKRGQGIAKNLDEKKALAEAKRIFQYKTKYGPLNMALDRPGIFSI